MLLLPQKNAQKHISIYANNINIRSHPERSLLSSLIPFINNGTPINKKTTTQNHIYKAQRHSAPTTP